MQPDILKVDRIKNEEFSCETNFPFKSKNNTQQLIKKDVKANTVIVDPKIIESVVEVIF